MYLDENTKITEAYNSMTNRKTLSVPACVESVESDSGRDGGEEIEESDDEKAERLCYRDYGHLLDAIHALEGLSTRLKNETNGRYDIDRTPLEDIKMFVMEYAENYKLREEYPS